jgi:DNA ligase-1
MRKFEKTLYKIHSTGQIGEWMVYVDENWDNSANLTRESRKVLDGKPVKTQTVISEGKNIGRSNQTTAVQQAIMEAESLVRKQIDKGYVENCPQNSGEPVTNSLGFYLPMLALPIDKVSGWSFPVTAQPKYNGHRLLAGVRDGVVILYSRKGKIVDVAHVRLALQSAYDQKHWSGCTLDGEIYAHGESLQHISSLVKKPKPESASLVYHLYDLMSEDNYLARLDVLRGLVEAINQTGIALSPSVLVHDDAALNALHTEYLGNGYEGTMVRDLRTGYEAGKRSKSLMKKKDFQDAEFLIVGAELGKPDIKGDVTYQRPVFRCVTAAGATFNCTAPGTMQERHRLFEQGLDTFTGRQLTVKFFDLTPDNIPFLPVALGIRDDI